MESTRKLYCYIIENFMKTNNMEYKRYMLRILPHTHSKVLKITLILSFYLVSAVSQADVLRIGAATKIINNEIGGLVQGAGVPRYATEIRDNLEVNALYLSKGEVEILMISCDLGGLESPYVIKLREAMGVAAGIPPRNILVSCTHTHGGPSVLKTNYLMPLDTLYLERLHNWLVELAKEAVGSARPGKIGWAMGETQIGYNRRVTWEDGSHTMHGDTKRKDFNGLEGPDDPSHLAMFAADKNKELLSIVYNNTTHPTIFYAAGVYSADFPGEVRKSIRSMTKKNIPILFLNGAQGDIAINDMFNPRSETKEEKLQRISKMVVDETMDLYRDITYDDDPVLKHDYHDLKVAVRLPSTEALIEGKEILERIDAGENIRGMEMIMAFGAVHLQETYRNNPYDILPVHAIRLGELAIVTQPCELYCQFGLDIKRRSPVSNTIVVGLTDGFGGYCPTIYGVIGGGYSGAPIAWARLEPYAGYKIVESASQLLYNLWLEEKE
jgi:neutral ceramidase